MDFLAKTALFENFKKIPNNYTCTIQCPTRVGSDLESSRVGSGQKILTDFEFYISQIAGLDEIMILLL